MELPPLTNGTILRRYKRFLADVERPDGSIVTAHCPNTGAMTGCWAPGMPVQISHSDNPKRKLAWTLERVDMGSGWIGVNTNRTNALVAEAIEAGRVPGLAGYHSLRREVPFESPGHPRSRLDLFLSQGEQMDAYVEVKNVTLLDGDRLRFPDAVSKRGQKHLDALLEAVHQGFRGVLLFALNRPEGCGVSPADGVDPVYAQRLREVVAQGVEVLALRIRHSDSAMWGEGMVEVMLSD